MSKLYRIEKHKGYDENSEPEFVAGVIADSYAECSQLIEPLEKRICKDAPVLSDDREYLTMQYISPYENKKPAEAG